MCGCSPNATVPGDSQQVFVTKEQREASPLWQGLQYAPEISAFYKSFLGPGLFMVLSNTSTTPPIQSLKSAGLSEAEIT